MAAKRLMKIAIWTFGILILIIVGVIGYVISFLPKIDLVKVEAPKTEDNIRRGHYLANNVMVCLDCHSTRDWQYFSGPVKTGTEGQGGEIFDEKLGLPGKFVAPNITPYALKNWTDAEIFRALTAGVNKKGKPLFPIMPYPYYGTMDEIDILNVISYLRTLPEISSEPEKSRARFPMNLILHFIPKEPIFQTSPNPSDSVNYGKYLVTAGACIHCHTVSNKGELDLSKAFAGGQVLYTPQGTIVSANITPSKQTGIGNWEADGFVARFKAYEPGKTVLQTASNTGFNTIMPWTMYAGMSIDDLKSIFLYLKSLQPIENKIEKTIKG
jgi:mono/diheme cytochrome c family protein